MVMFYIFFHKDFPSLRFYNRFVELMQRTKLLMVLFIFINSRKRARIYYINSTYLAVCHIKKNNSHKTFAHLAKHTKGAVGWFFDFKIHLVINNSGELIAFKITKGNKRDFQQGFLFIKKP